MLIALLHNPNAGRGRFDPSPFVRQLQDRGQQVLYVPVDKKGWEAVFGEFDQCHGLRVMHEK